MVQSDDRGNELHRARDHALASIAGNSLGDRYERMALHTSWDDHTAGGGRDSGDADRSRLLAEASALAADAKFGTNLASSFANRSPASADPTAGSRYFYDTEFHWAAGSIRLISIAIVSGDGREFYAHADQYDPDLASDDPFLAAHVLPAVAGMPRRTAQQLRGDLDAFLRPRPRQLWVDFGAWDQVALMQIWGGMGDQPSWLPMQSRDVRLFASLLGRQLPDYPAGHHDALIDARHVRTMFGLIEHDLHRVVRMARAGRGR